MACEHFNYQSLNNEVGVDDQRELSVGEQSVPTLGFFAKLLLRLPHTVKIKNDVGLVIARVSSVIEVSREVNLRNFLQARLSCLALPIPGHVVGLMRSSLRTVYSALALYRQTIAQVYVASLQNGRWCRFDMQLAATLMAGDSVLMYDAGSEVYYPLAQIDGLRFNEKQNTAAFNAAVEEFSKLFPQTRMNEN